MNEARAEENKPLHPVWIVIICSVAYTLLYWFGWRGPVALVGMIGFAAGAVAVWVDWNRREKRIQRRRDAGGASR